MMKFYVCLVLVAVAEKSVQLANKILTMEQLHSIYATKRVPDNIYDRFYTAASRQLKVPNTMAWLFSGDLETSLERYHQDHLQDVAMEHTERVNLYLFPGGRNISRAFQCQKNVECTITAEWDGHHWLSRLTTGSRPSGWDPASRAEYLDSRPDQIGVWFYDGHMLVTHTFSGPRMRWLVFNQAFLVSGQLFKTVCGIWNYPCTKAILNSVVKPTKSYPVGLVTFSDINSQFTI
ncbi:hypothetical protein DSO57_1018876 [Entomophthora muscae]|uniref:Uncharacterized protein n=1 Tax=Entomophthora muscae TaxID=34485 RepID=A0ACC2S6A7_9FUNG|nr:hypothetical protein DSO57_1018876 [Entomophthora muscae]